ncbi:MAG: hypothetical protein JO208_15190 [Alphaproteobacteria bacterium]|nr:hypothetical protein [Alphaproteobacteria bacterium]
MTRADKEAITKHSGWLIPLGIFVVTAALSGAILLYYLVPSPGSLVEEHPSATASTAPVALSVGGVSFVIPANYIRYRSARRGGSQTQVALFALLPDFRGYTDGQAQSFLSNAPDSPVVNILLHEEELKLNEQDRLRRIYLAYVADPKGRPGPFGLEQFEFRADSGYRGEDLFVGRFGTQIMLLRCVRGSPNIPSPGCLRETRLARHAGVTYRFKRSQLSRWREIASGVEALMHSFMRGR